MRKRCYKFFPSVQFCIVTYSGSHSLWRMHAGHTLVSHGWLFSPSPNKCHHTLGFSCPHSLDLLKAQIRGLLLFWRGSSPADSCKEAPACSQYTLKGQKTGRKLLSIFSLDLMLPKPGLWVSYVWSWQDSKPWYKQGESGSQIQKCKALGCATAGGTSRCWKVPSHSHGDTFPEHACWGRGSPAPEHLPLPSTSCPQLPPPPQLSIHADEAALSFPCAGKHRVPTPSGARALPPQIHSKSIFGAESQAGQSQGSSGAPDSCPGATLLPVHGFKGLPFTHTSRARKSTPVPRSLGESFPYTH